MVAEIEFLENGVKGGDAGLERLARGMMNVSEIEFYSAGVNATTLVPGMAAEPFRKALDGSATTLVNGPMENGVYVGIDTGP